jgi:hypothetical protein
LPPSQIVVIALHFDIRPITQPIMNIDLLIHPVPQIKRSASQAPLPEESPAKKQSKWTPEEDNSTIELRGRGIKWDDIAKHLLGRSPTSCRLRYQNYLEKRTVWDEENKDTLARLYARYVKSYLIVARYSSVGNCHIYLICSMILIIWISFKDQMWQKVATEMGIPWRSAESMHWQLGEEEMSARANAPVFQLHPSATSGSIHAGDTTELGDVPLQKLEPPPRQILAKVHPSGVPTVLVPDNWLSIKGEGEIQPSDESVGRKSEE